VWRVQAIESYPRHKDTAVGRDYAFRNVDRGGDATPRYAIQSITSCSLLMCNMCAFAIVGFPVRFAFYFSQEIQPAPLRLYSVRVQFTPVFDLSLVYWVYDVVFCS